MLLPRPSFLGSALAATLVTFIGTEHGQPKAARPQGLQSWEETERAQGTMF